jgi:hypothetical protein
MIRVGFEELERNGLIQAHGFSIFQEWRPTHKGLSVLSVYTQVYGKDGDFLQLLRELDVGENSEQNTEHCV